MSLLLLKKKIQEKINIIGNPSFGSENYHIKESYARVLRWIVELEKEKRLMSKDTKCRTLCCVLKENHIGEHSMEETK